MQKLSETYKFVELYKYDEEKETEFTASVILTIDYHCMTYEISPLDRTKQGKFEFHAGSGECKRDRAINKAISAALDFAVITLEEHRKQINQ